MTQHILSLSYGKDSLACLGAIEKLGWQLDRIVHAEIWATDTIPADLPPMVEFKAKADEIIKQRYGIEVEHIYAIRGGSRTPTKSVSTQDLKRESSLVQSRASLWSSEDGASTLNTEAKLTYESIFYRKIKGRRGGEQNLRLPNAQGELVQLKSQNGCNQEITGFASRWSQYCTGELKREPMASLCRSGEEIGVPNSRPEFSDSPVSPGANKNTVVQYLGIALDEPKRLARLDGITKISPLAAIGWTEADARKWCEENDLLSPIYTTATRGGCWFCHNQSIGQLRLLRKNYPDLWGLLLKWDTDSPVSFHPDGRTVHDFDRRFQLEDEGKVPTDRTFRWKMLED